MFSIIKKIVVAVFFAAVLGGYAQQGPALGSKATNLEAERQQLFEKMLARPDDLDIAFSYAALSVRVGDLEGAVSTLERMLIFSPGLSRLQLELGILYYRLGNFDTSESYFKSAVSKSDTPSDITIKAEEYLAAIEKKLKRFRWSAKTYAGLRWQSNANFAPGSRSVTLNGLPITLDSNSTKKSDFSFFSTSRAHFEYDLQNQGDKIELDYVDFTSFHFNQTDVDAMISEITVGPAFNLGRFEIDETFASVYAILNGAVLNERVYFGTLGVGSRIVSRPSRELEFIIKGEFRRQWFNKTSKRIRAGRRDGYEYRGLGEARYRFTNNLRGVIGTKVARMDRRADFFDYWEYGANIRFEWAFNPVKNIQELPWVMTVRAGYLHRDYDDPDPIINTAKNRDDDEYWVGGTLKIPLNKAWAVIPKVEYREVDSNNPIRAYKAFTASLGVQFRQ